MKKEMIEKAMRLYDLTNQIKEATKEADEIKKDLRLEMTEPIEFNDVVCKKVTQVTPTIDNQKLYNMINPKDYVKVTKVLIGELKKMLGDEYDDVIDKIATEWIATDCIKFTIKS
jgi:hypothetical protein